jgi:hypothetical protein
MLRRLRFAPLAVVIGAVPYLSAATARADLLTASAANCNTQALSQTFAPWSDPSEYFLAPGGDFAAGSQSWSTTGGASVVAGGDGFSLNGNAPSTSSLSLPAGSSATTPAFCVGVTEPDVRLFVRNSGSASSTLQVSVTFETTLGLNMTVPFAVLSAGPAWAPTAPLPIVANLLTLLPHNETPVMLTFAPQGGGGNWQIDDAYVDPTGMGH